MFLLKLNQIVTAKGLVLGNLNSPQRAPEVFIMSKVWEGLGIKVMGGIQCPGKLEGGDYFTIDPTLALIGQGPRTNAAGIQQLLDNVCNELCLFYET